MNVNTLSNIVDEHDSFSFHFELGNEQDCITKTENELRYLINTEMTDRHGASWLSNSTVGVKDYAQLINRQQDEIKKLASGPALTTDIIEYCYIHELKEIIEKNWNNIFGSIFPSRDKTSLMLEILSEYRNTIMHGSDILLPHQRHFCLGVGGELLLIVEKWRIGLKQNVKSYECAFSFSVPSGDDSESSLEKKQAIEKTKEWVNSLKKKARKVDDKSNDRSIAFLLRLPEGHVTISSDKKDGDYLATPNQYGWSTYVTIRTNIIGIIDRIVAETDKPYWVYRMILDGWLELAHIESQIQNRTGEEPLGRSGAFVDNEPTGQSIKYSLGKFKDAPIRLELTSGSKNEGSTIEMVIDRPDDEGFYQAHNILTHDVVLSFLLGEITPIKKQLLLKEACSKPVNS
jgi:hypothetical protein